jgi:hypothetical protein
VGVHCIFKITLKTNCHDNNEYRGIALHKIFKVIGISVDPIQSPVKKKKTKESEGRPNAKVLVKE